MLSTLVQTVVAPAAVTAALLLAGARPWRRARERSRAWLAVSLAGGFVAGYLGVAGTPRLEPLGATDWLVHIAALTAVAAALRGALRERRHVAWLVLGATALAVGYLVMRVPIHGQWSAPRSALAIAAFATVAVLMTRALESSAARTSSLTMLAALGIAAAGSAGIMVLSGTALVGMLVGGLASAIGAAFLVEAAARGTVDTTRAAPVVATLLAAAWAIALLFAELPPIATALLIAGPMALWLAARLARGHLRPRLATAVCLAALALPVAGAAGIAAAHYFAPADAGSADAGAYDYGYD